MLITTAGSSPLLLLRIFLAVSLTAPTMDSAAPWSQRASPGDTTTPMPAVWQKSGKAPSAMDFWASTVIHSGRGLCCRYCVQKTSTSRWP
eukprot:7716751-Alexandrium_andersonii.AAC.1